MHLNLDSSCTLCKLHCPLLKNKMDHFYETNIHLNEKELYKTLYAFVTNHLKELHQQNLNTDVSISLSNIENHYKFCHVSKNMLIRDIRKITHLQQTLEINPNSKNITLWLKLSTQKLNLLNQFKKQEHAIDTNEPFDFS